VQVNYLGFPGTMGADYMDYLLADRVLIPPNEQSFYSEQVVYLPDTYQANDSRRRIAPDVMTRSDVGLPADAFVFCCFNGNQKILPETFDIWMRILHRNNNSVLWLLQDYPAASGNLRREAGARGIAPDRLIFAKHEPLDRHLARLRLADLMLDTLPYGGHTTASDALWAGTPVLTRAGKTFAGRVAASLLNAIGLPELITDSSDDYEALACDLAGNPRRLQEIRAKLTHNRDIMPLFDTVRMTRNLESAYVQMWERHQRGEQPASFAVEPPQ
jgi:predicted O-linked N-acetylglucosamine transferase (SPINDLY family)